VRAAERGLAAVERTYRGLALPPPVRAESDRAVARAGAALTGAVRGTLKNLEQGLPVLGAVVLSPFLAYYLLRDRRRLAAAFWHRVPDEARPRVARTLADLDAAVGGFLRGQILVAVLVGVMALGVSLAFRLPYPLFIALVAATTDLIPYVGPLLGAVPAVAVALLRSPPAALWVLGAFLAIHQFEGLVLSPNLVGARVGLHPLVVFGALLVGGELFGVAGVLVGVPVLAAVRILVRFGLGELRRWAGRPRRLSPLPRLR
jgi:predicted PurR-regulated permease PerM